MTLCKIMPSFSTILALMREKLVKREKNGPKKRKAPQHRNSCAMSSSTKHILPGELIDQVIDHLHDDSPSLRACCITCRAWVPSARFHIFRNIVLSAKHADALAVILETSPHIFPLVRSLTISGTSEQLHKESDYLDAVIPTIAPKLTKLKTLRFYYVTLAQQHPNVLSALIHNFSTIQELCIEGGGFNRPRDFATLIVAYPCLECLDVSRIWWRSATPERHCENVFQEYPDLLSRLRCITLNNLPLGVINWMSSYHHVLPVHTVTVNQSSRIFIHEIQQMARLFQLIGSSLEHLTFCIYQYNLEPLEVSPPIDAILEKTNMDLLSFNTRLRTLTFNNLLLDTPSTPTYPWLPVLLSQVTFRYIEEISFVLWWDEVELIKTVNLKLMVGRCVSCGGQPSN
ncbi:hypothetical protein JB92DRAFT_1357219 [Gautieria morchelliformis]|nr:hypothetical protein JB92DRAFT_1357219 [Gautieria morchelliformis]